MCPHVLAQIVGENIPAKIHDSHVFSPVCIYRTCFSALREDQKLSPKVCPCTYPHCRDLLSDLYSGVMEELIKARTRTY